MSRGCAPRRPSRMSKGFYPWFKTSLSHRDAPMRWAARLFAQSCLGRHRLVRLRADHFQLWLAGRYRTGRLKNRRSPIGDSQDLRPHHDLLKAQRRDRRLARRGLTRFARPEPLIVTGLPRKYDKPLSSKGQFNPSFGNSLVFDALSGQKKAIFSEIPCASRLSAQDM